MPKSLSEAGDGGSRAVRLKIAAGSPLAEIFLINHDFALVNRSVGDLDANVPPGVYKVKSKLGDATAERVILLDTDATLDISDSLLVRSPVPLPARPNAKDSKVTRAPTAQRTPQVQNGAAEVFLMTRGGATDDDAPPSPPQVSLHHLTGTTLTTLEPPAGRQAGEYTTTVTVAPGPYIVRRRDRYGDTAELCVHAVAGWQTQVFTLEQPGDEADVGRTRVSILMSQHGFDPTDPELHTIEEARTALADERKIATNAVGALCESIENPMLALFWAHLMLIARDNTRRERQERKSGRLEPGAVTAPVQFNQARFNRIIDRLTTVLGPEHPDVIALTTQRSGHTPHATLPISAPPMLWRSWVLLLAASNTDPTLVPVNTWQRTWHVLPLRPFFLWAPADDSTDTTTTITRSIAATLVGTSRPPSKSRRTRPSSALESPGPAPVSDAARRRVSQDLLVPRAAIDRIASGQPL